MSANVEHWTRANSEFVDAEASKRWSEDEISWGLWRTPEAEIGVFMGPTPLLFLCGNEDGRLTEQLHSPMRGMYRFEAPGRSDEFVLSHGDVFSLLRRSGFEVENLVEVYAPEDAERHTYYAYATPARARRWPSDEIWVARKP